jgi:hypothetical protein
MLLLTMKPRVSAWVSQAHTGTFYLSGLKRSLKLTLYMEFLDRIYSPRANAAPDEKVFTVNITVFCLNRY